MIRRLPLWATLLPLLVAVAGYWFWWDARRDAFAAELRALLGQEVATSGFPYRLEAETGPVSLARAVPDARGTLSADDAILNRGPRTGGPTVAALVKPRVSVDAPAVQAASLSVDAASAQGSLRLADDRVSRLSFVFANATVRTRALAQPATATGFETHFRETPQTLDPQSRAATFPQQAQLVLEGSSVRYGGSDPLAFVADLGLTARAPVRRLADWLPGGTVELRRLELRQGSTLIATFKATASSDAGGRLLVAGTAETICPAGLEAMVSGRPAPVEKRARRMVRFTLNGSPGALTIARAAGEPTRVPVRNQEPPCPVLRR
jgi:hypothetical protein